MKFSAIFFALISFSLFSQVDSTLEFSSQKWGIVEESRCLSFLGGFNSGNQFFSEVGLSFTTMKKYVNFNNSLRSSRSFLYKFSTEFNFQDDFVWGIKGGVSKGINILFLNLGANIISYFHSNKHQIHFRPEAGFEYTWLRLVYGYNFALNNKDSFKVNTHNFTVAIQIPFKYFNRQFILPRNPSDTWRRKE